MHASGRVRTTWGPSVRSVQYEEIHGASDACGAYCAHAKLPSRMVALFGSKLTRAMVSCSDLDQIEHVSVRIAEGRDALSVPQVENGSQQRGACLSNGMPRLAR